MGFLRKLTVEGMNLERFVRQAAAAGIVLHAVERPGARRLEAQVDEAALPGLTEQAEEGGWRCSVGCRVGMGRTFERVAARRWLLTALLAVTLGCLAASRMVWHIRILDAAAYEPDVRMTLSELGVRTPMLRSHIDPAAVRDALEWRYPEIAWVEAGWRGATLEIRLVGGITGESKKEESGACDVVATRDGIVQRLVTRAGTPVVQPGEVVIAGQVLIRGEERTANGGVRPVAARGSVIARVWDSVSVKTPLHSVETSYTGRTKTEYAVQSPWFCLWPGMKTGFEHEDAAVREITLGGIFWPLKISIRTHMEAEFRSVKTDIQSVIDEGSAAALQKLQRMVGSSESLVDNWVNWSIIEDEILLSVATGERLVDIGKQERSSGMAATE